LKRPTQNLEVVYTIKLSKAQRIKLLQLGGPQWIRTQIEQSAQPCPIKLLGCAPVQLLDAAKATQPKHTNQDWQHLSQVCR